jgi:hypothetical protein
MDTPKFKPGDSVRIVREPADIFNENVAEFGGYPAEIQQPAEWIRGRGLYAYDLLVEGTECAVSEDDLESA